MIEFFAVILHSTNSVMQYYSQSTTLQSFNMIMWEREISYKGEGKHLENLAKMIC